MTDRYLEKVQPFTTNNCFGRLIRPANRSSRSQMLFKIGVLKSFAKFMGKAAVPESLF